MLQCLIGHHRTQVGAADSDIDDIAYALAGVTLPGAAPYTVGEVGHFVEHIVNIGHDIMTVNNDRCLSWRAQRYVKHGPILGTIDFLASEHGVDPRPQTGLFRQLNKELKRLVRNTVFRVIEVNASRFGRHTPATFWVSGKESSKMLLTDLLRVILELFPCRALSERTSDD
jgi:hypothetical protein